ncbi:MULTISPECIES: helicase-associated domain-containing protein [Paenibacillus]|uniref:helicase-associated domain-containing protein n=1 Tax=Paenibacillus TaxID=44249 RepID=UPI002FE33B28
MIEAIFRRFAGLPFKLEKLDEAAVGQLTGADLRAALPGLLRSGQLAAVKKAWGEMLYYIPAELLPDLWEQAHFPEPEPLAASDARLQREAGPGLALDLFRALAWAGRNGLPVTSKGTLHQRSVSKLAGYLYLQENDIAGLDLRYPHHDVYPPQLAVVLDLLLSLELIMKERASWSLNSRELSAWLALEQEEMDALLCRELLHRYIPDDVSVQHCVYRLIQPDLREGMWYSLGSVFESLQSIGLLPGSLPEFLTGWMEKWLKALAGFGWLDFGTHGEDKGCFRWRQKPDLRRLPKKESAAGRALPGGGAGDGKPGGTTPSSPPFIIVQPDFEILVPPDVSYRVRWELEACCENLTMDRMSVYRLSRQSVSKAAELGRFPGAVLELLEAHAEAVPDNVRSALEQWSRELGRTSFEERLLLRCADEAAAGMVAVLPALAGLLERIGPRDFIVDAAQAAKVRRVLEEARLAPPKQGGSGAVAPDYPRLEEGAGHALTALRGTQPERAWIFNGRNLHFYEPSEAIPQISELFPGYEDVPGMWLKELRHYHASTARKIMEQAIGWRTKVELKMNGSLEEFYPLSLKGDEKWTVVGRLLKPPTQRGDGNGPLQEELELTADRCEAMRLMMSDIP